MSPYGDMLTLAALNRMDRRAFAEALGGVFEHSPWVAERAWAARPFASVAHLHRALTEAVRRASEEEHLALLRAHPDLAGKARRAGGMSAQSEREQSGAGLDRLDDAEYARFDELNTAYREKCGFPFIICVRDHTKTSILSAFERRLSHAVETEIDVALSEVFEITRHRLEAMLGASREGACPPATG